MHSNLKLAIATLAFAVAGCAGVPVTGRDWNCPRCYK
jgi:hypothetical protein